MKNLYYLFLGTVLLVSCVASAQPATVSYPFAVGRTGCGSGTQQIHFYNYNSGTNTISNATGGMVNSCIPELRIGTTGGGGGSQRFTSSYSSISYNPQDKNIYFFWTAVSGSLAPGGIPRTYAWRWAAGTCPTATSPRLDTIRSFPADILGVAFDNSGNGYIIEFTNALPTVPPTYKPLLRSINFSTGVLGAPDTLSLTGGAKIYQQGSGDVVMTPSGQMFFVVDNKLFTPNYKSYTGTNSNITCTYVDTVINSASGYFVGLTYADGETVSAYSGSGCNFYETNMLTAATTNVTKSGTVFSAADMATIVSGIGSAKRLVSVTPTVTPGEYDVIYDIYVQNYGNTDITNVQVRDDLTAINGAANVSNVSISFVSNPAGLTLNGSYNGNSNTNLLNGTGTLPNYPVSNNNVTIRISCRLSNIQSGVIYNNSAIATAVGYNSQNLRDTSTNGANPDLNSNDKPDDIGESQPTPLLITVTSQTTPCATLNQVMYAQTFGSGTGLTTTIPAATGKTYPGSSGYTGSVTAPLAADRYTISNNAINGHATHWVNLTDHTGGANGRMLLVNADAANTTFYRDTIHPLCPNQEYSLFFFAAFIGNSSYQTVCDGFGGFKYPNIQIRIRDAVSGAVITEGYSGNITTSAWNQYGIRFVMPPGFSTVIIELINAGEGGCGNDLAIDDIQFGTCSAAPTVSLSTTTAGCLGGNTTFSASLTNSGVIAPGMEVYQWQISTDSLAWTDIPSATLSSYVIASTAAGDINKFYRVIVAASGNIGTPSCQYISPGFRLTAKASSTAPTAAAKNRTVICPGENVTLQVTGGILGTNAQYRWYSGSCGGTLVGSGSSISVNPSATTTYYVRIEGDCNTTTCVSVTVTVSCDIDIDKDGITNTAESGGVNPLDDDDFDGIENYRDSDYPGFIDSNGDGINDNFDADLDGVPNFLDRDSDNDGIPDVVEAGGVDANGDGRIDNYTDTDNDGLSQNVDANNTGAAGSGNGLGLPDLDGDGIPNYLDLDSDNDGIPDVAEAYGTDANNDGRIDGYADSDNDGFADSVDGDVGNDGTAENASNALLRTGADINNDGRADSYPYNNMDNDSKANPYDLDSDGDGITDVREAGFTDSDWNGRIDGSIGSNGWSTTVSAMPALNLPDTDASGRANPYDIDSDNDGIPDNIEGQTTNSYSLPSGSDNDGDGIDNTYDNFNGFGGDGIHPPDTDGDGTPDYMDLDTDNDGLADLYEGNDLNLNGVVDDAVVLSGIDTDGDGLDDFFDSDNTSARGTSAYMGNGGSNTGDSNPGSITTVQQTLISASAGCGTERDWRCLPYILACDFISFKGSVNSSFQASLIFKVICRQPVDYFIIQRSVNGTDFYDVKQIDAQTTLNEVQEYLATDNISAINSSIVYYRLKAVALSGKTVIGNIIMLRPGEIITEVTISPNPVRDALKVTISVPAAGTSNIYIINADGKTIQQYKEYLHAGSNQFSYLQASGIANGIYYLQVHMNGKVETRKFSIYK